MRCSRARARTELATQIRSTGRPWGERVLGQRVDPVTKKQAADAIVRRALVGEPGTYVCLTNVHTTVESQRSAELRAAVDRAFLSVPDGMPLTWILRRRGHIKTEKVTGIEFIPLVASRGLEMDLRTSSTAGLLASPSGPGSAWSR